MFVGFGVVQPKLAAVAVAVRVAVPADDKVSAAFRPATGERCHRGVSGCAPSVCPGERMCTRSADI